MVCIAAFIVLCLMGVFVAVLSIFRREIGRKYWTVFKKAWGCVGRRVTFQKCETNFKEDVKNSILRKVVIRKPKLVKPISIALEVLSVLVVLITAWSLVEGAKAGLSLYALGTCTPARPDACIVSSTDVCPVNNTDLNWFEEWGAIFQALPDRTKNWDATTYLPESPIYFQNFDEGKPVAIDVFDPMCDKCLQSFRNQLDAGFLASHNVALLPYPTEGESREYRFHNSHLVATYILATGQVPLTGAEAAPGWQILQRMFTEFGPGGVIWQGVLKSDETSEEQARAYLEGWLIEWGYSADEVVKIHELAASDAVAAQLKQIAATVRDQIHATGVPTTIYDGNKHTGVFQAQ
jgi:hypothetical protein